MRFSYLSTPQRLKLVYLLKGHYSIAYMLILVINLAVLENSFKCCIDAGVLKTKRLTFYVNMIMPNTYQLLIPKQ